MKILGIIPARFASSRFPGKPLADILGKSMIRRVYEQSMSAGTFDMVTVATDDKRIMDHVCSWKGNCTMTSPSHRSGTERCFEALQSLQKFHGNRWEAIINIQGDEPFIQHIQIQLTAGLLRDEKAEIATLCKKIITRDELFNTNVVKLVCNTRREALYFSRSPIPFARNLPEESWAAEFAYFKHIGIYGYRSEVLGQIASLPESPLEKAESLEQLRWLVNGYKIMVALTDADSIAVDTPEDLLKFTNMP